MKYNQEFLILTSAFGRMGNAYSKLGELENAIKFYGKSLSEHRTADILEKMREAEKLKKQKDEESYRDPVLADTAREKGNELFKSQQFADAVKHYTESIKRNPFDPRSYTNRATCLIKLMALPEADKDCDKAIELDPEFTKAYIRKASILFAKKDYMKCVDMCNVALTKDGEGKHANEIQNQVTVDQHF
jgi:stress-induced-phosphoprotein 1